MALIELNVVAKKPEPPPVVSKVDNKAETIPIVEGKEYITRDGRRVFDVVATIVHDEDGEETHAFYGIILDTKSGKKLRKLFFPDGKHFWGYKKFDIVGEWWEYAAIEQQWKAGIAIELYAKYITNYWISFPSYESLNYLNPKARDDVMKLHHQQGGQFRLKGAL